MSTCCVLNCSNEFRKTSGKSRSKHKSVANGDGVTKAESASKKRVSYFSFPKDAKMAKLWLGKCGKEVEVKMTDTRIVGRGEGISLKNARICSDHFDECDYEDYLKHRLLRVTMKRILKKDAVPHRNMPNAEDNYAKAETVNVIDDITMSDNSQPKSEPEGSKQECEETSNSELTPSCVETPSAKETITEMLSEIDAKTRTELECLDQSCDCDSLRVTTAMLKNTNATLQKLADRLKSDKEKLEMDNLRWESQITKLLELNRKRKNRMEKLMIVNKELKEKLGEAETSMEIGTINKEINQQPLLPVMKKESMELGTINKQINQQPLLPRLKEESMEFFEDKDYVLPFPASE